MRQSTAVGEWALWLSRRPAFLDEAQALGDSIMFRIFKQKPLHPPRERAPSFVEQLITSALAGGASSNARLATLTLLWNQIRELEDEYAVNCAERDSLRDELEGAFSACTNAVVAITSARMTDLFSEVDFGFSDSTAYESLDPSLQLRLVKLHIQSRFDGLERHPSEYEPMLQHAFHAVELQGLDEFAKKDALKEFGVAEWESLRNMNPHVIFEFPAPGARKS
jgi:hypothetical protein